jgi:hypothetical protein
MTKSIDRRAVLRSTLVIGAISATPIAAGTAIAAELASAASGPDTELVNLIGATREAMARRLAATAAVFDAERSIPHVPPPDALIATEADARLWDSVTVGEPVPDDIIWDYKAFRAQHPGRGDSRRLLSRDLDSYPLKDEGDRELMAFIRQDCAREARADELIAAFNEHADAKERARESSGATDAEERQVELYAEELNILRRAAATRPHTIKGALAMIALVTDHIDPNDDDLGDVDLCVQSLVGAAHDLKGLWAAAAAV